MPEQDAEHDQQRRLGGQQAQNGRRPRADGAQDRHLAPPLVQRGEDHRHHAEQRRRHHHRRDRGERRFGRADQPPQLLQRRAGQDGRERLGAIVVDGALQPENRELGFQADQRGGDRLRLQVHLANLVRRNALAGNARAALPIDMDGLDGFQADMHGAVDRRAGLGEDAGDLERLVVMFEEPGRAEPVRDDDLVAELIAELRGDIGADHRVEQIAERLARRECQLMRAAIAVALEIVRGGAHHAKTVMAVAERDRHDPVDIGRLGDLLIGLSR